MPCRLPCSTSLRLLVLLAWSILPAFISIWMPRTAAAQENALRSSAALRGAAHEVAASVRQEAAGATHTLRHFDPQSEPVVWYIDRGLPVDSGFVFGTNIFLDRAKATAFSLPAGAARAQLNAVTVWFAHRQNGLTNQTYRLAIYDGSPSTGPTGAALFSREYLLTSVQMSDTEVLPTVHQLPAPVAVGSTFFVVVDFGSYAKSDAARAAIAASDRLGTRVPEVWEQLAGGSWYNTSDSWAGQYAGNVPVPGSGRDGWHLWVEADVVIEQGPGTGGGAGQEVWVQRFDGAAHEADRTTAMTVDDDGNVYIVGTTNNANPKSDYVTIKYDAQGNRLWTATYAGTQDTGFTDDIPTAVAVDQRGNVYVTGYTDDWFAGYGNYVTVKYDANGNRQWVRTLDANGLHDQPVAIAVDPAGNVVVTGYSRTATSFDDYLTVKYGPDGTVKWQARYKGQGSDVAAALFVDGAGNVYVTGTSDFAIIATVKYDAAGVMKWEKRFTGDSMRRVEAIAGTPDGGIVIAGNGWNQVSDDFFALKYDAAGTETWRVFQDFGGIMLGDVLTVMEVDAAGNIYLAGFYGNTHMPTGAVAKVEPNGTTLWQDTTDGRVFVSAAVDGAGHLFVTGHTPDGASGVDFKTYGYDSQGDVRWEATYDGPAGGDDKPVAVRYGGDGGIYVAGYGPGYGTGDDIVVIRYGAGGDTGESDALLLTYNQADVAAFPLVHSYVTVTNRQLVPVTGLAAACFTVEEDGQLQQSVTATPVGTAHGLAVALVVDRSGSMTQEYLGNAKSAAQHFVDQLGPGDRAALLSFSAQVSLDHPFTTDRASLKRAIDALVADGATALYDGIIEAVNQIRMQTGRKAIVLLSDGGDTASSSSIDAAMQAAVQAGVPIFTIGLGSGTDEAVLQKIADDTGGRYYAAPTADQLQQIYQLLAQQLQNQYRVSYTTSRPVRDGSTRQVGITVTCQGGSNVATRAYVAPSGGSGTNSFLVPVADGTVSPGGTFTVEVRVGSATRPVKGLFGLSFVLQYTQTASVDVVPPVVAGDLLGSSPIFYANVEEAQGRVSVGISRKSGEGGVNGHGVVVRIPMQVAGQVPDGAALSLSLRDVLAIDAQGAPIPLDLGNATVSLTGSGLVVWPGDHNNDGAVNQVDVLPLGLHWARTGAPRSGASMTWTAQPAQPWNPVAATFADGNGDGLVNQADVLAVGLNWSKTRGGGKNAEAAVSVATDASGGARLRIVAPDRVTTGETFWADVAAEDAVDLFGLAFELALPDAAALEALTVEAGSLMGADLLFYPHIDAAGGVVSVGLSRKAGQGGVNGSGTVARVQLRAGTATQGHARLVLQNVVANDPDGNPVSFTVEAHEVATATETSPELPTAFALHGNYPNPFNPVTAIQYALPSPADVQVVVYDLLGRPVRTLVHALQEPGVHTVTWDGRDAAGSPVASGVYMYQLRTGAYTATRMMTLVK